MNINTVLVVCVGNVCRSPMAQAMLASAFPEKTVKSAGTDAMVGRPAEVPTLELMTARGLDISAHRAQQVSALLCKQADIVLVMDYDQRHYLHSLYPSSIGKVFRIGHFSNTDVPDPYRQSRQVFELTLEILDQSLSGWIERLKRLS